MHWRESKTIIAMHFPTLKTSFTNIIRTYSFWYQLHLALYTYNILTVVISGLFQVVLLSLVNFKEF